MPNIFNTVLNDGTNVISISHNDGSIAISNTVYQNWVTNHPTATTSDAELAVLNYFLNHLPSILTGTLVTGTLNLLQVRKSSNSVAGIDLYIHVFTISPPNLALEIVDSNVTVNTNWWGV